MRRLISWLQINHVVPWALGWKLIKRFLCEDFFELLKVGRCLPCQHPCQFCFLILSAVGWTAVTVSSYLLFRTTIGLLGQPALFGQLGHLGRHTRLLTTSHDSFGHRAGPRLMTHD